MRRPSVIAPAIAGLVLVLAARLAFAAPAPPTAEELARHVGALTAPEMEGRGSATEGGEQAARYLESALSALGLRPGGDNGTWRQSFVVRRGARVAPDAALGRSGAAPVSLTVGRDWMPHGGAQPGEVEGELVFAGRGADYASVDVRGKLVLLLEGGGTRLEQLIAARHAGAAAALSIGATLPSLEPPAPAAGETWVVYTQADSAEARERARSAGLTSALVLRGGYEAWGHDVLNPTLPLDASAADEARFRHVSELSRYFGGQPRRGASQTVESGSWMRRGC